LRFTLLLFLFCPFSKGNPEDLSPKLMIYFDAMPKFGKMHRQSSAYSERIWLLLIWGAYLLILGFTVIYHEPWRDEFHSWNIARVSNGLWDLMQNKAYEGHGIIWYVCCWLLTRFTESPVALAGMHYVIVAFASGLFVLKAPFSKVEKLLLLLGYFFLFEYGTLARNYSILFVLLWGYCSFRLHNRPFLAIVAIAFMPFTQIYGILFGLILGVDWLWENHKMARKKLFPSLAMLVMLFLLAFLEIKPPGDGTAHARWYSDFSWESISYALSIFWEAFVPIPPLQFHFWNTNFLTLADESTTITAKALLGLGIWLGAGFIFFEKKQFRILFFAGSLACLAFAFAKLHAYTRHHGHLYVWLWVVLWLANQRLRGWRQVVLFVCLLVQLFAGIYACLRDWQDTFSPVKMVSLYLEEIQAHEKYSIWVADPDYLIEPLGALGDHELYFPKQETFAFFPQWDNAWGYISPEEVLLKAQLLAAEGPVLLLLGYEMNAQPDPAFELQLLRHFPPGIEASERFWLYELRKSHGRF